jgi:hypothetical protein
MRQMGLSDSRHVTLEEQLAIFLHACVTGLTVRHLAERFQRSNETIAKYVPIAWLTTNLTIRQEQVFQRFFSQSPFYTTYVTQPSATDPCPREIRLNKKYYPFFKDMIGVIDSSHIHVAPPTNLRGPF